MDGAVFFAVGPLLVTFSRRGSHILPSANSGSAGCRNASPRPHFCSVFVWVFQGARPIGKAEKKKTQSTENARRISTDGYAKIWTNRTGVQIRAWGRLPVDLAGRADVRRPVVGAPDAGAGVDQRDHGRAGRDAVRRDPRRARRQQTADSPTPSPNAPGDDDGCGRKRRISSTV